ncbi:hypothetical protein D3C80_677610 [compost metagenome]
MQVAYGADAHLRLSTRLEEQAIDALQDFVEFLKRWRFIPARFEVRDWITRQPLDQLLAPLQMDRKPVTP